MAIPKNSFIDKLKKFPEIYNDFLDFLTIDFKDSEPSNRTKGYKESHGINVYGCFEDMSFYLQLGILMKFIDKRGIQIKIQPEHYTTGINWNWQLWWYQPQEKWVLKGEYYSDHTMTDGSGMYGDNAEYPTMESCYKRAITEAFKRLSEGLVTGKPMRAKNDK
jgi:hypothetical protein